MTCCFIGHRKIKNQAVVFAKVKEVAERLITQRNARVFHFGSRSEFDDICHKAITELQGIYPDILRIQYPCRSEYVVKKGEGKRLERGISELLKKEITLKEFEGEKISERVFSAGKASYVERNQDMIDDSEYCVFFYMQEYAPSSKGNGNSGTKASYEYAVRKKKEIINIFTQI